MCIIICCVNSRMELSCSCSLLKLSICGKKLLKRFQPRFLNKEPKSYNKDSSSHWITKPRLIVLKFRFDHHHPLFNFAPNFFIFCLSFMIDQLLLLPSPSTSFNGGNVIKGRLLRTHLKIFPLLNLRSCTRRKLFSCSKSVLVKRWTKIWKVSLIDISGLFF